MTYKRSLTVEQVIFEEKRLIPDVNIFLSDSCNLNCKSCMNFSSIAEKNFIKIEDFEEDIKNLCKIAANKTARIDLMGGEPLLHPDIISIMKIARKYFPKTNIAIETNGILIPYQSDDFWETCAKTGIIVRVSRYPKVNSIAKLKKFAKEKQIIFRMNESSDEWMIENQKCAVIETNGGFLDWKKFPFDLNGLQNPKYNWENCEQHCCCAISEGKFYPCTKIPNVKHFNKFFKTNLKVSNNDFIELKKVKSAEDILEFLERPLDFCKYCDIKKAKKLKWGMSEFDIKEWT